MVRKVFLNWLRCEIVLNHNSYISVATALNLIEERRQRAMDRGDSAGLEQLKIVEEELRKHPAASSLLSVQMQEEDSAGNSLKI
jgi:hypothetical protein